ncbi:Dot/Icm T4SS effector AnkY/LegA9 [Legionella brunensis]|uniref:Ankyrin-repeat containing protein, substrate of the Dot/Icm secretion system n=1 Tax=Legionella brunensis TaxID=29422 RepID=A0A0W0S4N4_9GAMM|nr:Dot/Icm T4SS effector AnkY/LegA9 [Legionella brunensis]KTC78176.1 Ankyrin-repeat containing protein, substrate of the Dot/Icm secretion system [Legionella brunensis]
MTKVILIYANCNNPKAKGDFSLAGNIARDLVTELSAQSEKIDVILVSTLDGISRFESLYGKPVKGRVNIEGTDVGLCSLEQLDAVENNVVGFIEANRCKHAPADLVKRVLSPESKFLFVGNINQQSFSGLLMQTLYRLQLEQDQTGLYNIFSSNDIFIGSAGVDKERLGLPTISKAKDLPALSLSQTSMLPKGAYGAMYVNAVDGARSYVLIAQYMKLTGHDNYVLIGDFSGKNFEIQTIYNLDKSFGTPKKTFPQIEYHQSLPNSVLRKVVADTTGSLVLSTGSMSVLEALQDGKLPYYQDLSMNIEVVTSYLIAVKSVVANDSSLFGCMPQLIIELSELLFADKPLSRLDMERTHDLLEMSSVSSKLIATNQKIIEKANGKLAPRLLGFLNGSRSTNDSVQLATVCASLRKSGEIGSPLHDQALRRAAAWGKLFELKVVIKSMIGVNQGTTTANLDKRDANAERSALHWAVKGGHYDCARELIKAGASVDIQDKDGKTPLHEAVTSGNREMIQMLIEAGASVDIDDKSKKKPVDCAPDNGVVLFIKHCEEQKKGISV